eukprot:67883_1
MAVLFIIYVICSVFNINIINGTLFNFTSKAYGGESMYCLPNEDCDVYCNYGYRSTRSRSYYSGCYLTLYCPTNYACSVYCGQHNTISPGNTCIGMIIHAEDSSELKVNIYNGPNQAFNMEIYAPDNGNGGNEYSTNIKCGDMTYDSTIYSRYTCSSMKIFAKEGWLDVNMTDVSNNGNTSSIKTEYSPYTSYGFEMNCGATYQYPCNSIQISNRQVECDDQSTICNTFIL